MDGWELVRRGSTAVRVEFVPLCLQPVWMDHSPRTLSCHTMSCYFPFFLVNGPVAAHIAARQGAYWQEHELSADNLD